MKVQKVRSCPEPPVVYSRKEDVPSFAHFLDVFDSAIEELFFIRNPRFKKGMPEAAQHLKIFKNDHGVQEIWIYYKDKNVVVRTVSEDVYFELRTSRNRNVITHIEQEKYREAVVGIAGLSVGSSILNALAMSGGPKRIKIADFDVVEISNLNRIKAGLLDIGSEKVVIAARNVWAIDPFAELSLYVEGVSTENLEDFLIGTPKLGIFVDQMDSLNLKFAARYLCRMHRIPVLMATDNGDSVVLDVERFDLEEALPLFHGLVSEVDPNLIKNLKYEEWLHLAAKIVGPEYLTERMQDSIVAIGREIAAVPQLGTTAAVAGTAVSFAIRRIVNGQDLPSGRYELGCEESLIPGYATPEEKGRRAHLTQKFLEGFKNKK